MGSYDCGKAEACSWIREHVPTTARVLDVGACDGKWADLLPEYTMDAVEAFRPNAEQIWDKYRTVFMADVADVTYWHYDLVIFGDVLEHMPVEKAQAVLAYAKEHADNIVIGIPFEYVQGEIYGNPWEVHVQDDLTPELFEERYPGNTLLIRAADDYAYYVWRKSE